MAVLDVLELVFKSNATELQSDLEKAEKGAKSTKEELEKTDVVSAKLGKTFLDTITKAQGTIAAIVSIGAVATSAIAQAAKTDEIGRFSDRLGQNVEVVSTWSGAVVEAGGSADGFRGTVQGLQDSLIEMSLTGGGPAVEVFARLGIQATDAGGRMKNAFQLLPEIAGAFEGLSKAQAANLGQKLGLDEGTILLLQRGRHGVDELLARQRELGVTTQQDVEVAREFSAAMSRLNLSFENSARSLGTLVLPVITFFVDGLTEAIQFMAENQDLVVGFFAAAATVIGVKFLPVLAATVSTAYAAAAPFLAMAAVVVAVAAAFALLYEDILNFLAGNDSFIGTISEKWPIVGDIVHGMVDTVKAVFNAYKTLYDFIVGTFVEGVGSAFDAFREFLGFGGEATAAADAGAQAGTAIQSTSNQIQRNNSVSIGKVAVDARGGNSKEIAAGVSGALQDQMSQTISNFDDGVMN